MKRRIHERVESNSILLFVGSVMISILAILGIMWVLEYASLLEAKMLGVVCLLLECPLIGFSIVTVVGVMLLVSRGLFFREGQ